MRNPVLIAALLALSLTACGFRPRGALVLPEGMGPLAVTSVDPYSPLPDALRRALRQAGVSSTEATEGTAQLRIESEVWSERPLTVDAFVTVREMETRYAVSVSVVDASGASVLPAETIELTRDYVYEATQSFGVANEQVLVQDELRRDMAAAILRRVDVALRAD
jgi:outer membrane lipopolysaccharide assembly protein LptE/RlpB